MNRMMRMILATTLAMLAGAAMAHEMSMAEMELRETSPGEFLWQWTAPSDLCLNKKSEAA